jgi:hypothetical protein
LAHEVSNIRDMAIAKRRLIYILLILTNILFIYVNYKHLALFL